MNTDSTVRSLAEMKSDIVALQTVRQTSSFWSGVMIAMISGAAAFTAGFEIALWWCRS